MTTKELDKKLSKFGARLKPIIGTLAHNRTFRMREIDQYTRFDPQPLSGWQVVTEMRGLGLLSQVVSATGPNEYHPSREGWDWIETGL